jgi:hypothetical protein
MENDYIRIRAREFIETLQETLPTLFFHAYVPQDTDHYITDLYLLGFVANDLPFGGYCISAEQVYEDFAHHMLNVAQFFRKAWQQEESRYFPPELEQWYETHRVTNDLWWRVA